MSSLALLAVSTYFLAVVMIGYYFSRKESSSDFLIASKNLGWKSIGFSIFASLISGYNIVLGITFAFLFGIYFLVIWLGVLAAFIVVYFIGVNIRKKSVDNKFISLVDHFYYVYGKRVATLANCLLLFVLFFLVVLQINVNTIIFSNLLGWGNITSALIVGLVVLLYLYLGGFKTVVKTDVFQGVLMLIVIVLMFMVDSSSFTVKNVLNDLSNVTILFSAIALGVVQFLSLIIQPELWQRVYAARGRDDLRKGFALAFFLSLLIVVPEIVIGLSAKFGGSVSDAGNLFYDILANSVPIWFAPFVVVALFAAFMSSLDSTIFAMSSQLAKRGFISGYKDKVAGWEIKKSMRAWMIGIVVAGLLVSLTISDLLTSVFQLISVVSVLGSVFLISIVVRLTRSEVLSGLIAGIAFFVFAVFSGMITSEAFTSLYPSLFVVIWMVVWRGALIIFGKR